MEVKFGVMQEHMVDSPTSLSPSLAQHAQADPENTFRGHNPSHEWRGFERAFIPPSQVVRSLASAV